MRQALDSLEASASDFDAMTIGTVAAGCALGYLDFRFADRKWRDGRPKLAAWFESTMKRPSFQQTIPKG